MAIRVFGQPFVKRFTLCYRSVVCLSVLSVCLVFDVGVLWPNGWTDQDEFWHAGRPRPRRLCDGWVPSYSRKRRHTHPTQLLAHVYCGQTAGWMETPLGTEVDLGPGHTVLDGTPGLRVRGTAAPPLFGPCLSPISATAELLS